MNRVRAQFGFLRTTALGGLIFLLPLIVVGALVGQAAPLLVSAAEFLGTWIPIRSAGGIVLLVLLAIAAIGLLCFLAGLVARLSFGQRFSRWAEKTLQLLFPRYAILRDQMADNVGGDEAPRLKPVLVEVADGRRLAFESDRAGDVVAVYLPGAPDTWSGHVVYVPANRVEPLNVDFGTAVTMCEALGRESIPRLLGEPPSVPADDE